MFPNLSKKNEAVFPSSPEIPICYTIVSKLVVAIMSF